MAMLKNAGKSGEKGGASRGAGAPGKGKMTTDINEEAPGVINKKHFGHVLTTAKALHGSDPYKHCK